MNYRGDGDGWYCKHCDSRYPWREDWSWCPKCGQLLYRRWFYVCPRCGDLYFTEDAAQSCCPIEETRWQRFWRELRWRTGRMNFGEYPRAWRL